MAACLRGPLEPIWRSGDKPARRVLIADMAVGYVLLTPTQPIVSQWEAMTLLNEDDVRTHCVAGASIVALLHALTVAGATYQVYILSANLWNMELKFFLVNYSFHLAPSVLAILVRKSCLVVALLAIPVSILFGMRTHNVWQCWWLGSNSMAQQKGDELGWITMLFEAFSGAIAGALAIGPAASLSLRAFHAPTSGRLSCAPKSAPAWQPCHFSRLPPRFLLYVAASVLRTGRH